MYLHPEQTIRRFIIMKQRSNLAKIRRFARQAGQGMTEYIIIVAVIAIGSIAVYSYFGDTLRNQTSAAATALAGESGKTLSDAAKSSAETGAGKVEKNLTDFAKEKTE
jgi:Flp pilus assembly pilin Flp